MRVIATLSTIPSRIGRIQPMIESLLRQSYQIEKVEVNVPYWCVRTEQPYEVPDWLTSIIGVEVHRTEDYGAITKIAPTLIRHDKEDVYIWSVDDDFVYHPTHLETIMKGVDGQNIVCLHGGIWTQHGFSGGRHFANNVDIVEGFFGIVYPPNCIHEDFLPYIEKTSANWDNRKSDDIIISNYFALHKMPMVSIKYNSQILQIIQNEQTYGHEHDALKHQDNGHYVRYVRVLHWLIKEGICAWKVNIVVPTFNQAIYRPKRFPAYHEIFPTLPVVRIPRKSPYYFQIGKKV